LRDWWHPGFSHYFGWQPWQMNGLRLVEYEAAVAYLEEE
jgi:hypothetical protein